MAVGSTSSTNCPGARRASKSSTPLRHLTEMCNTLCFCPRPLRKISKASFKSLNQSFRGFLSSKRARSRRRRSRFLPARPTETASSSRRSSVWLAAIKSNSTRQRILCSLPPPRKGSESRLGARGDGRTSFLKRFKKRGLPCRRTDLNYYYHYGVSV